MLRYPFSLLCIALIFILCFSHPTSIPLDIPNILGIDKIAHFIMYLGTCGVIWTEYLLKHERINYRRTFLLAVIAPIALSGGIEFVQGAMTDYRGADIYRGNNQGYASSHLTYHSPSDCGANYSFVVDHGGNDQYGCRAGNNAVSTRGMTTGFIIDRPAPDEPQPQTTAQGQPQAVSRPSAAQGFQGETGAIRTMASPPPTVEPVYNFDNAGGLQGGLGRGWRLFGGGM
jgi:hypothetical protein